jgi:hypothetical protein
MSAFKFAGALGFALFFAAAAAQAASSKDPAASLRRSASGADAFSNTADGSTERPDLAGPSVSPVVPDFDEISRLSSSGGIARPPAVVPPAALAPHSAPRSGSPIGGHPLAAAAVLGTGLLLALSAIILSHSAPGSADPVVAERATARSLGTCPAPAAVETSAPAAQTSAEAFAAFEAPRAPEPFIDTRMPVSTWRAISRQEQALIESWDRSREKALGRASLEQWLDRHPVANVDIAGLKAKLLRA